MIKIGAVVVRSVPHTPYSPLAGESKSFFTISVGGNKHAEESPHQNAQEHFGSPARGELGVRVTAGGFITTYEILIIQPIPKNKGEVPHFVLPRGSRQYQRDGAWIDVRDVVTAEAHRDTLEPFSRALAREIEEEAGISAEQLARAQVIEIGVMDFQSRSKGIYPIYWYLVMPDVATASTLAEQVPVDALSIRWASLDEIRTMAAQGSFSAGYVPVIEAAFARADGAA